MNYEIGSKNFEHFATPEYWDGHHGGDNCMIGDTPLTELMKYYPEVEKQREKMIDRIQDHLENFRHLPEDSTVPHATFGKGSTFIADNYPNGTLIRNQSENISLRSTQVVPNTYSTLEDFGFIVDTTGLSEDGKNVILYVKNRLIYGGSESEINVGEVSHFRMTLLDQRIESLSRVNKIEVMLMGTGSRKRVEEPKQSGNVFGNFVPNPINP